jgi:hypothetical protein
VTAWLILLALPSDDAAYTYAPERRGDMVARFAVEVPEGSGPVHVHYALTVEGGATLQVATPELTDPAGGWKVNRSSAWTMKDGRTLWTEFIELEQEKPGVAPLPDVRLDFRDGPEAAWQRAEWNDVLKDIRELPVASPGDDSRATAVMAGRAGLAAALVGLLTLALVLLRRRNEAPLTPSQRALRDIRRLEGARAAPTSLFAELSDVLRRYLAERYGLPALQQTTSELLRTAGRLPGLAPEQECLRDIFDRCDLAKFAGVATRRTDWEQAAGQVRHFVDRTSQEPAGNGSVACAGPVEQAPP